MRCRRGFSLVESLAVLFVGTLLVVAALPAAAYVRSEGRTAAGARYLAATLQGHRWKSVSRRRAAGLFFERREGAWIWWEVEDGNGNDLRVAEIRRGVDPVRSGPHRLGDRVERVELGFPPVGPIRQIPPKPGWVDDLDDPVQFGRSDLVSFTPSGGASSGTLYVTDGRAGLFAVVLFGPTARVRVWRYDAGRGRWTL